MGLDIYLEDRAYRQRSDAHEKAWEAWWSEWGDKPDSPEKAAAKAQVPPHPRISETKVPSTKYPEHYMNRRYLRSSYNGAGFNRAVPDMTAREHGFYWIFEPVIGNDPEPYETRLTEDHIEKLGQVKKRALQVAQEILYCDPLRVECASGMVGVAEHMWSKPPKPEQVLDWYREEQERRNETVAKARAEGAKDIDWRLRDSGYSNAKGTVLGFTKGVEVLAVTAGRGVFGEPAAVFIYRLSDETKRHYVQTAEIVAEFADEAVELIKRDGECWMTWSG
jgi:hypothetical protein